MPRQAQNAGWGEILAREAMSGLAKRRALGQNEGMNTPISEIFIRLGWAFLCGFLIFMVPLLIRKARYAETGLRRTVAAVFALLFFVGFCATAWILWHHYVPETPPAEPSPSALPVTVRPS